MLKWLRSLVRRPRPRPDGEVARRFIPTVDLTGKPGPPGAESPMLRVFYIPGYERCNYRCPYCITGADFQGRDDWSPATYTAIVAGLTSLDAQLDYVTLGVGGEPLTSAEIINGIAALASSPNITRVNAVTNLFPERKQLERLFSDMPRHKLGFACTYHPTQAKDMEQFLDKVLALREMGIAVCPGCVAYPPDLETPLALKRRCDELGLPMFLNGYIGEYRGRNFPWDFTDEERGKLAACAQSPHDVDHLLVPMSPKGKPCGAGSRQIMIGPDGSAYRCSHEMRTNMAPLGNILRDGGVYSLEGYLPCEFDDCMCTAETTNTRAFEDHYELGGHFRIHVPKSAAVDDGCEPR